MCGIAGAIGLLEEETLQRMADKISHRGPDNTSIYSKNGIHLAHVRLSIIDLSPSSDQPLWDVENRACIVFNGEIYNYQSIKAELIDKGYQFASSGDSEVLLNLYLEYGSDCLSKLSGIFSFAIWDKDKQELFIARDNYGVKPFYYSVNESGFYFASEIKSLLEVSSIKKELNFDSLFRSLVFLWSPGEETILDNILKLKPAHFARIRNGKIIQYSSFWQYPSCKITSKTVQELTDSVYNALEDAVEEQLVADVSVGAFLSGGLDSSFIVALANQKSTQKVQCFTIDSGGDSLAKEGFTDDLPYAKKVADLLDVELDVLKVTPDITALLPKMLYYLDELQADPAPLNVLLICEQARKKGVKVLLSGAGGDDVFTGYRRHYAVVTQMYWSALPKFCRKALKYSTSLLPKKNAAFRRVAKAFQYADKDENERLLSYFYWLDPEIAKGLFKDSSKITSNPMGFMLDEIANQANDDPIEKMLFLEKKYFLVDHNFNYTDKMSMATGVEVRVPFLDKRVVEAAAEVPSNLKQKGRVGKWILKKAAEKVLPNEIIYRPKSGFGAPLRTWLQNDLAPLVDSCLNIESIDKRGVFNAKNVLSLIEDDRQGKADYSYPIFALLCFELWCQQFLD